MKGIILAGGSGTRLYPLTKITSKQLLPVYDKPMIYYPLAILMLFKIKDILIISTPEDTPNISKLLGDGGDLGLNLCYKVQDKPNGIAEAFVIGEDFIAGEEVCLILGDNIFYMGEQVHTFAEATKTSKDAIILGYNVPDPDRFGVVELGDDNKVLSLEEKPKQPKSNLAVVGLYFYPADVVKMVKKMKPSARGELEITDLNKLYLEEKRLTALTMTRGTAWLDAGTPDSLMDAAQYIQLIEKRQGLKISCVEEIAVRKGFIDIEKFKTLITKYPAGSPYRNYLKKIYEEKIGK